MSGTGVVKVLETKDDIRKLKRFEEIQVTHNTKEHIQDKTDTRKHLP